MKPRTWARVLFAIVPLALAGCGVLLGTADDWQVADAAGVGATGGQGGAGGAAEGGGGSAPGAGGSQGCDTVYVDGASGKDTSDGCDSLAPKRTIQAAIDEVAADATPGRAIAVCAGTYVGPVVLDFPVSLRGGYACDTWERPSDYGYPDFAEATRTAITNPGDGPTLVVATPEIDASVSIDGFRIDGGAGSGATQGVVVSAGGPVLTHSWITGGSGSTAGAVGSTAVVVGAGTWPEIVLDRIEGGSGTASGAGYGSVGLLLAQPGAYPHAHHNEIQGGSGQATAVGFGSVGALWMLSASAPFVAAWDKAFEQNLVLAGEGDGGVCSVGLLVKGTGAIDILGNIIHGGTASGCTTSRVALDVVAPFADAWIVRNRVYGGDGEGSDQSTAMAFSGAVNPSVFDNMVHGGNGANSTIGISITDTSGAYLAHNSVFAGAPATGGQSGALVMGLTVTASVVDANLLFTAEAPGTSPSSLTLGQCADEGPILALRHNWITSVWRYTTIGGSCPTPTLTTTAAMEEELTTKCTPQTLGACNTYGGAKSSDNVEGSCADALPGCATTMFGAWNGTDHGASELGTTGWKLQSTAPCSVTQSKYTLVVPADLYGTPRTLPVSMGAHELDGLCVP